MRHTTPTVHQGWLTIPGTLHPLLIAVGTAAWFTWLETATLFFFEGAAGTFTARKEQRQRGGWYWKAYRNQRGKLVRLYLGKTPHLTQEVLEQAAQQLASRSSVPAPATHQHGASLYTQADVTSAVSTAVQLSTCQSKRTPSQVPLPPEALSSEPLLFTKIVIPPLRPDLVARSRLAALFEEAQRRQLVVLSAPAGYGKTTLLIQWCAQSSWPVAWVSLEASENDPLRFWRYVSTALEQTWPGLGKEALERGQDRPPPPVEAVVTTLLNALLLVKEDVLLILDDYHLITDPNAHHSLVYFIEHLPPRLHLVIASRTDPPLPLARLRARQYLFEFHERDLRFTPEEVRAFFHASTSFPLSDKQIATLAAATEGWIAALHLAAHSLAGCEDIPDFLHTFVSGTHHSLADYLAEEVLQHQPRALQTFLLHTALLDRLSGPLCEAVLGEAAEQLREALEVPSATAQMLLERLEQANLFLLPLDTGRQWYRYHHLFVEFLRERLHRTDPEQIPIVHQRAAAWYEQEGLQALAIPHALAGGTFHQAARLICQVGETLVNRSEVTELQHWLEALPQSLFRTHPRLGLLYAWVFATMGQYESAEDWLRVAERGLDELALAPPDARCEALLVTGPLGAAEECALLQSLRGEIAALRANSATFRGDIAESVHFAKQALENLPPDHLFLRGLSLLQLGIACWLGGDVRTASQTLSQACSAGLQIRNRYISLLATCSLAQVQMVQGKRHLAYKTGQEALGLASDESSSPLPAAAYAYVGMGQMCYEWNDLHTAAYYLEEGVRLGEHWGNSDMVVYGYTVLAQVKQAQGDTEAALEMLEQAERAVYQYQQRSWIIAIMVAQQVRLALMQGNLDAISRWRQQAGQDYVVTFEEVTTARIALALGQLDEALLLLERQAELAASSGRMGTWLEIRLLEALVYQQQRETARAIQALEEALPLAEPEGYLRLFLDEGPPMQALLSLWLRVRKPTPDPKMIAYVTRILGLFGLASGEPASHAGPGSFEQRDAQPVRLSPRERDILQHLAAGQTNEGIAAALVLEESTVKWHLSRIYAKLQVQNRTQAVLQAKHYRLL